MVIGIIFLALTLTISVGLHECGHLYFAKKFGALVPDYAIGFGPTLFKFTRKYTTYSLRILPLGGFVKILGMYAPRPAKCTTASEGQLSAAAQARLESEQEFTAEARRLAARGYAGKMLPFWRLSVPRRLVVMLAGPVTNLLLALVLMLVAICSLGLFTVTSTLNNVPECVSLPSSVILENAVLGADSSSAGNGKSGSVGALTGKCASPGQYPSPAFIAGLKAGDTIVAVEGKHISDLAQMREALNTSARKNITLTVKSAAGQNRQVTIAPLLLKSGQGQTQKIIGSQMLAVRQTRSISQALGIFAQATVDTTKAIFSLPQKTYNLARDLFTGQPRDKNSLVGLVGIGQVAGKIGSAQVPGYDWGAKISELLMLAAVLNISLFVLNLIPLLPLDGGHVAGALWEGAKRQVAKLRGVPEPAAVDLAAWWPVTYAVSALLLALFVLLVIADVITPLV